MAKKHPIVLPLGKTNDGSTNFDLISERWKGGHLFCFQRFSFRIAGNSPTQVDVGLRRGGGIVWLETFATPTADDIDSFRPMIWVPTDYQVVMRVVGGTDGDLCECWIYGYIEES